MTGGRRSDACDGEGAQHGLAQRYPDPVTHHIQNVRCAHKYTQTHTHSASAHVCFTRAVLSTSLGRRRSGSRQVTHRSRPAADQGRVTVIPLLGCGGRRRAWPGRRSSGDLSSDGSPGHEEPVTDRSERTVGSRSRGPIMSWGQESECKSILREGTLVFWQHSIVKVRIYR